MIVEEIYIKSFGKLKNFSLKFSDGLNIIYGKNESGKSTIQAFVKAMLYSLGRSNQDPTKSDRTRYSSWDSETFGGNITVNHNGKRYIISKTFADKGSKDVVSIIDAVTGVECSDIPKDAIGEYFLGVGEDAFENSVFVRQLNTRMQSSKTNELSERLINLAQSADENVSVLNALDYLNEHKKIFEGTNRIKGKKDLLENTLSDLKAELNNTKELRNEEMSVKSHLEELLREQTEVNSKISEISDKKSSIKLSDEYTNYVNIREQLTESSREITHRTEEIEYLNANKNKLEQEYKDTYSFSPDEEIELSVNERRISEIKDIIIESESKYLESITKFKKKPPYIAIGALGIALLMLITSAFIGALGLIFAFVFVIISVGFYIAKNKYNYGFKYDKLDTTELNNELKELKNRNLEILRSSGVESLDDYKEHRKTTESFNLALAQIQAKIDVEEKNLELIKNKYSQLLLEFNHKYDGQVPTHSENVSGEEEYNKLDAYLSDLNKRAIELVGQIKDTQIYYDKTFSKLRNISQITEEIENTQKELDECEFELKATNIAISVFRNSVEKMQMKFGPQLNQKAGDNIYVLSNGKYDCLKISDNFEIMFREYSDGMYYNAAYLSEGALDMAYLALRIAIMDIIFKNTKVPMFLDDVFDRYDDERAEIAIGFLHKLSEKNQIVLLSCQKRDTIICEDNLDINLIEL